jgi:hypothetical protein
MTALCRFGLLPSQSAFCFVATEATAEALLDALAAAEATESQGEAVDAATRRQRTAAHILRTLSVSSIAYAAQYVLVSSAAPDVQAETLAQMLRFCGFRLNPVLFLRLARAAIEAAQGTEAAAAALDILLADESWLLLSDRVYSAQVGQTQLLADKGVDVLATKDEKSLLCANYLERWHPSRLNAPPPPLADPIVALAAVTGEFASADAARAHAAAAEEERLFAALLKDPDVIKRTTNCSFGWYQWARSMNSVLGVRWV